MTKKSHVSKCSLCGKKLCPKETRFRIVCATCETKSNFPFAVAKVTGKAEKERIRELVTEYWGEERQSMFNKEYDVARLPAYYAKVKADFAGFIAYTEIGNSILIVALAVLPNYQSAGIGKKLVQRVKQEAIRKKREMLLVSTSNDNLPALAFYQTLGFQIFEIETDAIARKHGKIIKGISDLPIRDELRMRKIISQQL
jgi:ribosomal protein S18 acetylase RimI-like enzyme